MPLTELKSRYDEERSLKEAGDQKVAKLSEQLKREKDENERLQTELVQHTIHFCEEFILLSYKLKTYFVYGECCSFNAARL